VKNGPTRKRVYVSNSELVNQENVQKLSFDFKILKIIQDIITKETTIYQLKCLIEEDDGRSTTVIYSNLKRILDTVPMDILLKENKVDQNIPQANEVKTEIFSIVTMLVGSGILFAGHLGLALVSKTPDWILFSIGGIMAPSAICTLAVEKLNTSLDKFKQSEKNSSQLNQAKQVEHMEKLQNAVINISRLRALIDEHNLDVMNRCKKEAYE
jgi:hypothetical protein